MSEVSETVNVTALLNRSRQDPEARERVFRIIYLDLVRLARRQVGAASRDQTLSATSLINEAYLKLQERTGHQWNDRHHFLRVAARAMRQITIDTIRRKKRAKRGGDQVDLPLDDARVAGPRKSEMILALEEGLCELAETEPRWVEVIEMRFFAGLSGQETADALEVSLSSVNRDWSQARAWMKSFLLE
ncbi:MAG: ECF-type sigma factor [Xanthomonadales bacterium]|nr:ECF-type sigma factor [Xanthomonadales bacterium]